MVRKSVTLGKQKIFNLILKYIVVLHFIFTQKQGRDDMKEGTKAQKL